MGNIKFIISGLLLFTYQVAALQASVEYCAIETFNPRCNTDQIIVMQSALYGRMSLGRCLTIDVGYMGCQSDVLPYLDTQCSGQSSCDVSVSDIHSNAKGGCLKELSSYLLASFQCFKVLDITEYCPSNPYMDIPISSEVHISSRQFYTSCESQVSKFKLRTSEGQILNVTLTDMQSADITDNTVYGSIKEIGKSKEVVFGNGGRDQHLILSTSNEVIFTLSQRQNIEIVFILHVSVYGCPNLSPPAGAWMTRNGNVMEIGCHVGSNSWTLTCDEGQWIGPVGQCKEEYTKDKGNHGSQQILDTRKSAPDSFSLNAILFAVCSLIIFLSSVVFLIGVCLLKRRVRYPMAFHVLNQPMMTNNEQSQFQTILKMHDPNVNDPKSLPMAQILENVQGQPLSYYMNTGRSNASDSVKYYMLEDLNKEA